MNNNFQTAILVFLLLLTGLSVYAQENAASDPFYQYRIAMQAYQKKDYPLYLSSLSKMVGPETRQPALLYQIAGAYALNGNHQQASTYLGKLAHMGLAYPIATDPDFAEFKRSEQFATILKAFDKNKLHKHPSKQAFILREKDLIPEGIAYDEKENKWYVGSIYKRKIVTIDPNGNVDDFTKEGQDGLYGVLGMKVDEARRELWVCSAALGADTSGASGIFKYDLSTKKLIQKYILEGGVQKHLLNDLVIAGNGDIYATNSGTGGVFKIARDGGQPEEFIKPGTFIYPNGIALSPDGKKVLVADFAGISAVSIESRKIEALTYPPNTTLAGIDGLYLYNDYLVAVQNFVMPQRIIKMKLNKLYSGIDKVEVLEANLPLFEKIPTTGVVAGNQFYFIANSQLRSIDEKGVILSMNELQETVILKLESEVIG